MTSSPAFREGSELIKATRVFGQEDARVTWKRFATTCTVALGAFAVTFVDELGPLRWVAAVILGLTIVRVFIFYHDCLHGAVFRKSKLGHALMAIFGVLVLTPTRVWKDSHNYHHAHTSKLVGSSIGSYPILTRRMYATLTPWQRFQYRLVRHWLIMLFGYVFIFLIGMCIKPLIKAPRRNWEAAVDLVAHFGLMAAMIHFLGFPQTFVSFILPVMIACGSGSYLFYAQHTFEGVELRDRQNWEFTAAALRSSSMTDMSPLMHWFTGNIGFHHVHHLNSMIPFYRLDEAMKAIPELQHPIRTSLRPRDVLACLRLQLWDPQQKRMISFKEARGTSNPAAELPGLSARS